MTEDMNKDPYNCLKKLAADQNRDQFPDELVVNNSSVTNKLYIMEELSKSCFPDPKRNYKRQQEYIETVKLIYQETRNPNRLR